MKFWMLFLYFSFVCVSTFAQRNVRDSAIATPWVGIQYGLNGTGADLSERYGLLNHLGIFTGYKTSSNWIYGVDANFIFGNNVKVSGMFDHLKDSQGTITDINGDQGRVFIFARGFNTNLTVGKIIPILGSNENSGIYVNTGVGYLLHHIRIETQDQVIPQLELDYKKGYDRLVGGINSHQFIGYAFMANQGFLNFYGGFYIQEGFTYEKRTIFFDQPDIPVSKDLRVDLQYGFKVGWLVPAYKRKPKDYYYN